MKVDHPKVEFIYKNLRTYFYMFKLQSPSKYSPFDATHLSRFFSTAQNRSWTYQFWCLLVLLLFFCFTSSTSAKHFPLRTFFIWGNKKITWPFLGKIGWIKKGGAQGSCSFWSKTADHSVQCGQVCLKITCHEMGKHIQRVFKKKFTEAECSLSQGQLAQIQMGS